MVKPKLAAGVEINTSVLLKLAGQGNIYVRSVIKVEDSDGEDEDNLLLNDAFAIPIDIGESTISTHNIAEQLQATHNTAEHMQPTESHSLTQSSAYNCVDIDLTSNDNDFAHYIPSNEMLSTVPDNLNHPSASAIPLQPQVDEVDPFIIKVHRTMIKQDLIDIFSDDSVMSKHLIGIMINSKGEEEQGRGTGVLREIFSLFWSEFVDSAMIGEEERVSFIRHDYNRDKWQSVARILVKGFTESSYFPLRLCKVFMGCALNDESLVTVPMLLSSFKSYISKNEAEIVEKALSKELAADDPDLLDFLSNFDCRRVVTPDNIEDIIVELAHKELIQKPKYVSDCWSEVLSKLKLYFPTIEDLIAFYQSHEPTNTKVVSMLQADVCSDAEREAFNHLKKYVRGLDKSKLYAFLRFVTASDIIVTDKIQVSFSGITGAARRPVSHTCGCTLELPSTYANFCELREEFSSILSADSWEMDIV